MKPGDHIILPNGQTGKVVEPAFLMPRHHLIQLESGESSQNPLKSVKAASAHPAPNHHPNTTSHHAEIPRTRSPDPHTG